MLFPKSFDLSIKVTIRTRLFGTSKTRENKRYKQCQRFQIFGGMSEPSYRLPRACSEF